MAETILCWKIRGLRKWLSTFQNTCTHFLPQKFRSQTYDVTDNCDRCISGVHTSSPVTWRSTFTNHYVSKPAALTCSARYSNCQCLQYLRPSATPADTRRHWPVSLTTANNLMPSGIITIKILTYSLQHWNKQQNNRRPVFSSIFFKSFIAFRNLGTIKVIRNDGHTMLSKIYVHKDM
jgi:hypothetical protein